MYITYPIEKDNVSYSIFKLKCSSMNKRLTNPNINCF